jgi:toxin FitB
VSYLLDTNVISETIRRRPDPNVIDWLRAVPDDSLHTSVLCLGEIVGGIERLPSSARHERLLRWLEYDLVALLGDRVLAVDSGVAVAWGRLCARTARQPLPAIDSLLAATALHHDLSLVTQNEADFARAGVRVVNPWRRD